MNTANTARQAKRIEAQIRKLARTPMCIGDAGREYIRIAGMIDRSSVDAATERRLRGENKAAEASSVSAQRTTNNAEIACLTEKIREENYQRWLVTPR